MASGNEPSRGRRLATLIVLGLLLVVGVAVGVNGLVDSDPDGSDEEATGDDATSDESSAPESAEDSTTTTTTEPPPASGFERPGLLTFRGSAQRDYYGEGPVPENPQVLWSYPGTSGGMCAESTVGSNTKVWCGTGWTGQPSVFEHEGRTWVTFGAYDRSVHFVDGADGSDILPPFPTGDIIKGSGTIDPDGYPIIYIGSRDNKLRAIAFDRPEPTELWALSADDVSPTLWNNDWDGTPLVVDDHLIEGGENSQFHVVRLNRSYGDDGLVQVQPELVFNTPGWDDQLLADVGDNSVSIENSVSYRDGVAYFSNGGGLVQGWDLGFDDGSAPSQVFRFWTGDDTDASIVIDDDGFLYVASEYERGNARSKEIGQLLKLDPTKPDDPIVWAVDNQDHLPGGFWATPALHDGVVIVPDDAGRVRGWDAETGEELWGFELPGPTWQSPVIVDDVLIQGDCAGVLHAYDVSDARVAPPELWQVELGGCVESTPAMWKGRIYVGTRAGRFFAIGDPGSTVADQSDQ